MKKHQYLFIGLVVILAFSAANVFAATVYLHTAEPTVLQDTDFVVDILIDGVPGPGLESWVLDIKLDPLVELVNVAPYTAPWMVSDLFPEHDNAIGLTGMTLSDPFPTGDRVKLAELTFHCIGVGLTTLTPMFHFMNPELSDFTLTGRISLDDEILFEALEINQVPIPGAMLLFGSGLLGLMGIGRKRMRKS